MGVDARLEVMAQFKKLVVEIWQGFTPVEKYILWVFFGLGGLFIVLMVMATLVTIYKGLMG